MDVCASRTTSKNVRTMDVQTNQILKEQVTRFAVQKSTQHTSVDMAQEAKRYRNAFLRVEPKFDAERADKDILNSIFAWIWKIDGMNKLGLDYTKGLCLYGNLGLGKSMTMRATQVYMNDLIARGHEDYRLGMWWKSASEIANLYAVDGQPSLIQYSVDNLCVDELGREPIPASNFGTKMNVLQFLFQLRYDHRKECVTHITTNLSMDRITPIYGEYIADRFLEMFNFIELRGKSLR